MLTAIKLLLFLLPQDNIGLKKLNLAWNGFGEEGAIALAVALRHCTLTRLDVTNNRIGSEGYGCLVKSLRDNEYLKELIVRVQRDMTYKATKVT